MVTGAVTCGEQPGNPQPDITQWPPFGGPAAVADGEHPRASPPPHDGAHAATDPADDAAGGDVAGDVPVEFSTDPDDPSHDDPSGTDCDVMTNDHEHDDPTLPPRRSS